MRKIETKMINAIKAGKDMTSGNTEVRVMWANSPYAGGTATHCCHVMLHGNNIATVYVFTIGDNVTLFAVPNLLTLNQWPTPTTKSRLRALGVAVHTKRGDTYVAIPRPVHVEATYYCVASDDRIADTLAVTAGQRAYHQELCRVRVQHERDLRKAWPVWNMAQDLVINSDLKGVADLPEGIYILDELAGHGENK